MAKESAGLLLYRERGGRLEVLLVHPGGPFWKHRDEGAWSIPKGEIGPGEAPLDAAVREVAEELGVIVPGPFHPLGSVRQAAGKSVQAFAAQHDLDAGAIVSNTFTVEWPPRSGRRAEFPEADRADWFSPAEARAKLNAAQRPFLDRLTAAVAPTGWTAG